MSNWYVYIARLSDGRFYVGISCELTKDLLADHAAGNHSRFTRAGRVQAIEWTESQESLAAARKREIQLKGWSHAKKQALVDGDWNRLKSLSRSRPKR